MTTPITGVQLVLYYKVYYIHLIHLYGSGLDFILPEGL